MILSQFAPFSTPNVLSIAIAPFIAVVSYVAVALPSCLPHRCIAITPSIAVALALSIAVVNVASPLHLLSLSPSPSRHPSLLSPSRRRGAIHCCRCCRIAITPSPFHCCHPHRCCCHPHCHLRSIVPSIVVTVIALPLLYLSPSLLRPPSTLCHYPVAAAPSITVVVVVLPLHCPSPSISVAFVLPLRRCVAVVATAVAVTIATTTTTAHVC